MTKKEILFKISGVKNIHKTIYNASEVEMAMDEYAKEIAIGFFKWYVLKMNGFLHYIIDIRATVTSEEIEEKIKEWEGKSIEELYQLYLNTPKQ